MPVAERLTIREAFASGRTLIFGHRGAMAHAPMNTPAAFQLALEQGADGIELDVHLSRDERIVVVHDFTVDETTDGRGDVMNLTFAQLKRLDAGGWFADEFAGERIPTLGEVFADFAGKLYFNVELKSRPADRRNLVSAVADCISRHGMTEQTIVSSFDAQILQRFRAICPDVMTGFLHGSEVSAAIDDAPHEARHPRHEFIDAAYMRWSREAGYLVNAWTVNDFKRVCELGKLGVNGIITDSPADAIRALSQC